MNFVSSVYHYPIETLFIQACPPTFFALLFPLLAFSSFPPALTVLRCVNNPGIVHQHLGISSLRRVSNGDVKVTYQVEKTSDSVEVEG